MPLPAVRPLAELPDIDAVVMGAEFRPLADISAVRFLADEFGPVIAPSLAERFGQPREVAGLAGLTAIVAGTAPTLWSDWFAETGNPPLAFARTTHLEDLVLALSAARHAPLDPVGYGVFRM